MDMKTNTILAGIVMAMLLLALPATASDFTLDIFGNANEDGTINMQDVTYTELIILEYRDRTELSDAKHDGKINMQDVTQIELVILGKEKELTVLDSADRTVTMEMPIERVVVLWEGHLANLRSLNVDKDEIAGVRSGISPKYYPVLGKKPEVGQHYKPDYEAILELEPDLVLTTAGSYAAPAEHYLTERINVLHLHPDPTGGDGIEEYFNVMRLLGTIFDRGSEAEEYISWYSGYYDEIRAVTSGIAEDEKVRVLYIGGTYYWVPTPDTIWGRMIKEAGGHYIPEDCDISGIGTPGMGPGFMMDPEWILEVNPEVIIKSTGCRGVTPSYEIDSYEPYKELWEEAIAKVVINNTIAGRTEKVFVLSHWVQVAPNNIVGVAYMAKWFYPEPFEDLHPREIQQEFLTTFQGVEDMGVYSYPPLESE
jgi:iron complex transport system substrate-binding protein